MTFWMGGFRIVNTGWLGPQAVYLDIVTEEDGYLYQLYENRRLVGCTRRPGERRVVGHLEASLSPTPLSVVRVLPADQFTDFGDLLPLDYINRYDLVWQSSGSTDVDNFQIVGPDAEGEDPNPANVLGQVPFTEDGEYRWDLDALDSAGTWKYGVIPRDSGGNAGDLVEGVLIVAMPPSDVAIDRKGKRFTATAAAGVVTVAWGF